MSVAVNPKRTIYIEELLRAAFIPFGDIIQVNMPTDNSGGKGFAFIEYEATDDAMAAMDNMHNSEILGKSVLPNPKRLLVLKDSRVVWKDEAVLKMAKDSKEGITISKQGIVQESVVEVNAPKRQKYDPSSNKLAETPQGYDRCSKCGAWGKDVVKQNGMCDYCTSKCS
ncbi:peptidyl-prolyl cis-trans isomerase [Planoprotostelium fungivorum]|uniref:Peptidyl-prolyl cis-trans isomerase n=1 Tax=Planoprotostelium fungivorum TaxID=1890364 RepID=A0A2P6MSP5_9EUKA|nr:peptidyl-prolyl cis-trans isomerase [Planoprotostelium fungivorum]